LTYLDYIETEIGTWSVTADDKGINEVSFSKEPTQPNKQPNAITKLAISQLGAYFQKSSTSFDLPLNLEHHSQFFRDTWEMVAAIPYGKLCSYSEIAIRMNNPKAVRAVGMANGKNPFPLIIPCHRVIGKDKSLTGYASGIAVKKWLLEHEGAIARTPTLF